MNQGIVYLSIILGSLAVFLICLFVLVMKTDISVEAINVGLLILVASATLITYLVKTVKKR